MDLTGRSKFTMHPQHQANQRPSQMQMHSSQLRRAAGAASTGGIGSGMSTGVGVGTGVAVGTNVGPGAGIPSRAGSAGAATLGGARAGATAPSAHATHARSASTATAGSGPGTGAGPTAGTVSASSTSYHYPTSTSAGPPSISPSITNPLAAYKARKERERMHVLTKYDIIGYIAAGTYGRVYKARSKLHRNRVCAIKKFKADKEGEVTHYTGISQSACREMSLCRELRHENIISLIEVILEDKSIYMVFDYAEHDLLQIIHFHCQPERRPIPDAMIKSVLWQLLNGVSYLHQNWVLHRDLKPANIMLSSDGVVKIGDLGLARLFNNPLISLWAGDKVVVTIWYRAPELLLGARHYTPAIDLWAVGCIFAELLSLRPIFKGEEAKMDNKRNIPFQRNQVQRVVEILGTPTVESWPSLTQYPEYKTFSSMKTYSPNLDHWYHSTGYTSRAGFDLLSALLEYDPAKRITAHDALVHPYFVESPKVTKNVFEGQHIEYPSRRISNEDNDIKASSFSGKRSAAVLGTDSGQHHIRKKQK